MTELEDPDSIYLDNNATTRADERVIEAVVDAMRRGFGNPSSLHGYGEEAARLVEEARGRVQRLLGARSPGEVLFTSGGTESLNTALHSTLGAFTDGSCVTSATEHAAVARPLDAYAARGIRVDVAPVDRGGRVDVDAVIERIGDGCRLVTLHWANNETGAMLDDDAVARIATRARACGVPFHLDAVQIPGKHPMALDELGVDLASISAHKFHGPKGVGALYIRRGTFEKDAFPALFAGGSQEDERRAGTHNVPGIAGLGHAAALAREHLQDPAARAAVRERRDRLERELLARIPGASVHARDPRLDNTSSLHIPGVDGELLLASLAAAGVAVSGGAACSAAKRGPSPVLLAMGLGEQVASETLRLSLSRFTSDADVAHAIRRISEVALELRGLEAV